MWRWIFATLMLVAVPLGAQQGNNSGGAPAQSSPAKPSGSSSGSGTKAPVPNQMPRSDRVNADALSDEPGQSSSKDTQIDLSPPPDDEKAHPQSSEMLMDAEAGDSTPDVSEFHPWDPHRAAKDVEVGDF